MELKFEKNAVSFHFRNPQIDRYRHMVWEYQINGEVNRHSKDGFFFGATFNPKFGRIRCSFKLNGQKYSGVTLLEDDRKKVNALYEQMTKEAKDEFDSIVNDVISGVRPIEFGIVGCDYPHYQAWLKNLPDNVDAQKVMDEATRKVANIKYVLGNICEYLGRQAKKLYGTQFSRLEMGDKFTVELSSLLADAIEEQKKEIEKEQEKEARKASLKCEILKQGKTKSEDYDPYALVRLTDPATNESLEFWCRNIFDFGYTVNPNYKILDDAPEGGMFIKDKVEMSDWDAKKTYSRDMTEFEKKCIKYLSEFSPVPTGIRM